MSKLVDERVVEMSFDNKKFEENVGETLGTIDKLKKALNFDDAADAFSGIENAASKVDFSGFEDAVGSIGDHISGFEAMALGAFNRVGQKVADMAMEIAGSAMQVYNSISYMGTMDQGFSKYEEKTSSVQALVNATGKGMDEIDGYLDKLMWYSDETSYSFTEMTSALSQAALVGADLDEASDMIIGIANATAFAGKTGAAFQSTIRNIMQSFGSGALKSQDWKSLVLQGTATNRLTEELIRAGEELGRIQHGQVTVGNFSESLQSMKETKNWADQSVMELAFSRYAEATQEVYDLVNNGVYETATDAIPALLELGWTEQDLGYIAFTAAQQATSFKEAIDATADAVTTGWMRSFEYIFGNYEEAKKLWTDLSGVLWNIFAGRFEKQNEVLELFHDGIDGAKSARDYLLDGIYRVFEIVGTVIDNVKSAWQEIFPEKEAEEIAHSIYLVAWRFDYLTKQVLKFVTNEERVEKFASVIKGLASVFSILKTTVSAITRIISSVLGVFFKGMKAGKVFASGFDMVLSVLAMVGDALTWVAEAYANIVDAFIEGTAFQSALAWIASMVDRIKGAVKGFLAVVWSKISSFAMSIGPAILNFLTVAWSKISSFAASVGPAILNALSAVWSVIQRIGKAVGTGVLYAVGGVIFGIAKAIEFLYDKLNSVAIAIQLFIARIKEIVSWSAMDAKSKTLQGEMGEFEYRVWNFARSIEKVWEKIKEIWGKVTTFFSSTASKISSFISTLFGEKEKDRFQEMREKLSEISSVVDGLEQIATSLLETLSGTGSKIKDKFLEMWEAIKQTFKEHVDISKFEPLIDAIKRFWEALGNVDRKTDNGEESGILKFLDGLWEGLKVIVPAIVGLLTDLAGLLVGGISDAFSNGSIEQTFKGINAGLGAGLLTQLIGLFKNLKNVTSTGEGSPFQSLIDALTEMKEAGSDVDKIKAVGLVIVELAASLLVLSLVDSAKLSIAMFALIGVLGELKALIALSAASGLTDFLSATKAISKMGAAVAAIGIALAGLTVAAGKYGVDTLYAAVGAISLLLVELGAFAAVLGMLGKKEVVGDLPDMGSELLLMAGAVLIMAEAVKVVGNLERPIAAATAIVILLAALTGVIAVLGVVQKKAGGIEGMAGIGFGLLEIANAVLVLVGALAIVTLLKNVDTALLTIGALVLMVVGLIAAAGAFKPEHMLAIGAGIALITNSILTLVGVMALLQLIKFEKIENSLIALGAIIALIGGLIIGAGSIPGGAAGFLAFGAAFALVANSTLAFAAALLALAAAIKKIGWKPLAIAAGIIAGLIIVIGGAIALIMALLTPLAPVILLVGAAFFMFGAGVSMLVTALLKLVPAMAEIALGADVILVGVNVLVNAFMQFFIGILKGIQSLATTIVDTLILIVDQFLFRILKYLKEKIPKLVEDLVLVILALLKGLNDSLETHRGELELEIGRLVALAIEIVLGALWNALSKLWEDSGIGNWLEETWEKIKTWWKDNVSTPIQDAFASIKTWWDEKVKKPFDEAISAIETFIDEKFVQPIKKAWDWLNEHIFTPLKEKGEDLSKKVSGFFDGIWTKITEWYEGIKKWATEKIDAVKKTLTQLWDDVTAIFSELMSDIGGVLTGDLDFYETALKWINKLTQGIKDFTHRVLEKIDDIISGIAEKFGILDLYETAKNMIQGFINGVKDKVQGAIDSVTEGFDKILSAAKKALGINSPSKYTREYGEFFDEGLALGISDGIKNATGAAETLGDETLGAVKNAMDSVMDVMESDDSYSPTITPVYDLTSLYSGADEINSMLDSDPTALSFKMGDEKGLQAVASEIDLNNETVADRIDGAYSKLTDFMNKVKKEFGDNTVTLNVYGAEGQDVGELADIVSFRINAALQREKAVYS